MELMENISVGEYRSLDPPKNFAIRVKLKRLTAGNTVPAIYHRPIPLALQPNSQELAEDSETSPDDNEESEEEELVIHWQQKMFSEREFDFFGNPLNCLSALDEKYNNEIQVLRSEGGRRNKRIFTYVDADRHLYSIVDEREAVTSSPLEEPTYLVEKSLNMRLTNLHRRRNASTRGGFANRIVVENPSKNFQDAHVVTTASKIMKIMADLSPSNRIGNIQDEYLLCLVRVDANGQITVKPDFTQEHKLRVETFGEGKGVFEYSLEDYSVKMTKAERNQEAKLMNELYNKHAEMVAAQTGTTFQPTPAYGELFLHVFGEIVCAKEFEYGDLYVQYLLDLPLGWTNCGSSLFGTTQRCSPNQDGFAHFSHPVEFHLRYKSEEDSADAFLKWPSLMFEISSLDVWQRYRAEGYTYCNLPDSPGCHVYNLHSWRPTGTSVVSKMRRFFTGGSPELEDISYVKVPTGHEGNRLSKAFFRTGPSGTVTVRLYTMLHYHDPSPELPQTAGRKQKKKRATGISSFDALTHVLDSFHRARRRMLAAKSTLPSIT